MIAAAKWYLVVQCAGLVAFVVIRPWCRRLPDAGYGLGKSLGVLLCGTLLWLGTAYGLLRNGTGGAMVAFLALAGLAVISVRKARRGGVAPPVLAEWFPRASVVWAMELVFLLAFAVWILVRCFDPAANHTEQPMDLMLLTATSVSETFPPGDPWLAGYPIAYYYFGYWFMATVGHLSAVPPAVAYNVGQASWFGLLVVGCFGLGYNLHMLARRGARTAGALAAGALTSIAVAVTGNLHMPVSWLTSGGGDGGVSPGGGGWWWWRSSRAISDTSLAGEPVDLITEFPFFSYLLGDNHPHLLSMPFLVLVAGLALNVFLAGMEAARSATADGPTGIRAWIRDVFPGGWAGFVLTAGVVGALIALNTWDYPTGLLLITLAAVLPRASKTGVRWRHALDGALVAGALTLCSVVLFMPYLFTTQSQVEGFLPNLFHPTALPQLMVVFGTFVPGMGILLTLGWLETRPSLRRVATTAAACLGACLVWLVGAALWAGRTTAGSGWLEEIAGDANVTHPLGVSLQRWLQGGAATVVVSAALGLAAYTLADRVRSEKGREPGTGFALLLGGVGLLLVLVPEMVYIRDIFGTRMNTVFKFHYQAWLMFAVAGAFGVVSAWHRGRAARVASVVALAVMAGGWLYPPAATRAKTDGFAAADVRLDALAYLRHTRPDEHAAIRWIRDNTRPDDVIVQAEGDSYNAAHNLISVATGRPTLVGWLGHERQWRGGAFHEMTSGRRQALAQMYSPGSAPSLARALDEWKVDFLYLGPEERARYDVSGRHEVIMGEVMDLDFESGPVRLYRNPR